MKKLYILPLLAAGLLATGCSKENPFGTDDSKGEGKFLKSAISVDVIADGITRAGADIDINDVNVLFNVDGQAQPVAKYKYSDMPDIVVLPEGEYTCIATYGENRDAEWDSPYYLGTSAKFEVNAYEITSYIDPIECRLENIMVSVDFEPTLRSAMSADSYVEVKVGSSGALNFTTTEADAAKAGFFKHQDEVSLVAVFHGKVNGDDTVETKTLSNISKGNHYKIRFKLHSGSDGDPTGDINGDINVDATVTVVDVAFNVPVGEEEVLDDSERPTEGGEDPGNDPGTDPGQDPQTNPAPSITADAPVVLEAVNQASNLGGSCVIRVHSNAPGGITAFTCDIDSPRLDAETLEGVGLASHLDLVNTDEDFIDSLTDLGFPTNVGGEKDLTLDLSGFLDLLGMLGSGEHHFILSVSDAYGTTTKTLILNY